MGRPPGRRAVVFAAMMLFGVMFTCVCVCHDFLPFQYDKNLTSEINLFGSGESGQESGNSGVRTILNSEKDSGSESPKVQVVDDDSTVWQTETRVNIFKSSYDGTGGNTAVVSDNGEKIVAPGTSNDYHFKINNLSSKAVDYNLSGEAYFSDSDNPVPIKICLSDHTGKYIIGNTSEWADISQLSNLDYTAVLDAKNYEFFSFSWTWPFESGDDEYDTMLGNLAAKDENLQATVVFRVKASYHEDKPEPVPVNPDLPNSPDYPQNHGVPINTGETVNIVFWVALLIGSFMILLILSLCYSGKRRGSK